MSKTMDTNEKKENRQMPAGGGEIVPFAEDSVTKTNAEDVSMSRSNAIKLVSRRISVFNSPKRNGSL